MKIEIAGAEQTAGLGSHCWATWGLDTCSDRGGLVTAEAPLIAESPFTARLILAAESPSEITMHVYPAAPEHELEIDAHDKRMWEIVDRSDEAVLQADLSGQDAPAADMELDPGLYLFSVFTEWGAKGDATHGFLVEVH
ncbi:MAG: hypothetical protein WD533_08790 [Dehalococcoidia bacterium]